MRNCATCGKLELIEPSDMGAKYVVAATDVFCRIGRGWGHYFTVYFLASACLHYRGFSLRIPSRRFPAPRWPEAGHRLLGKCPAFVRVSMCRTTTARLGRITGSK